MRLLHLFLLLAGLLASGAAMAKPNCYIYREDEKCYEACKEMEKALVHGQGTRASQNHFLKAIDLCPDMAYLHFEMSVPYAKRGQMDVWIDMIDKAVELEPQNYLGQRGWYHHFFMHNYEKAIADIEQLEAITPGDIGETGDGEYHLIVLKALSYRGLGDTQRAIEIMEQHMAGEAYYQGVLDRLHLGVMYLEAGMPEKALEQFELQMDYNDMAEASYYAARAYLQLGDKSMAMEALQAALQKYDKEIAMHNPYRQLTDEIYRVDIEKALESLQSQGQNAAG